MNNATPFQTRQLNEIREERRKRNEEFKATKATAEIGIISNIPGTYTVNTLNGPRKANFENQPFPSKIEAVKAYARQFGTGILKKNKDGNFLVYTA